MFTADQFTADCETAVNEHSPMLAIRDVVERAISHPGSILADLGEPTTAGFHVLHHSDDLTILNFAWAPLMSLLPHDHADIWAVIGMYSGREDNIFWKRTETSIEASGAKALRAGDAALLGSSVIHSVLNPIPRMSLALHVYGGDFFGPDRVEWDSETLVERPYDVDAARRNFAASSERFARSN